MRSVADFYQDCMACADALPPLDVKLADAVSCVLNALGADIVQLEDGLIIRGVPKLRGGAAVDCRNDHRIAMMAAAAAAVCSDPVIILGAECVGKSYPDFWKVFRELGGAASAV